MVSENSYTQLHIHSSCLCNCLNVFSQSCYALFVFAHLCNHCACFGGLVPGPTSLLEDAMSYVHAHIDTQSKPNARALKVLKLKV